MGCVHKVTVIIMVTMIFLLVFSISQVFSESVTVRKSIEKSKIRRGETVKIEIYVRNEGNRTIKVDVVDMIDKTTFSLVRTNGKYEKTNLIYDIVSWKNVTLSPGESKVFYYYVSVLREIEGNGTLPPARILYDDKVVYSNEPRFTVIGGKPRMVCVVNGVCERSENYLTCPQDCPSGGIDAYCDGVKDGICDPDCKIMKTPLKDPDCKKGRPFFVYAVIVAVIVLLLALIAKMMRRY